METTHSQIADWFTTAKPGDRIVYKVGGHLVVRRGHKEVSDGVMAVRELYDEGLLDLVQRRLSTGTKSKFEYIAVKRRKAISLDPDCSFADQGLTAETLVNFTAPLQPA